MHDFNTWWTVRNKVKTSLRQQKNNITLEVHSDTAIEGLCIEIPASWKQQKSKNPFNRIGNSIMLPAFSGKLALNFNLVKRK